MGSLGIDSLRSEYPKMTDEQAATAYARENGFIVVMKYKNSKDASDYTDIAACINEDEVAAYMASQYCHDPVVIYDVSRGIGAEPPEKKPRAWWQFWKR
ncbi:MAG: hypothetical protein PVF95_06945 [bacterium]